MKLVNSGNRGQAKKLLTMLGTRAVDVRTMPLAELNVALQIAINAGLITDAGAVRALHGPSAQKNDAENKRESEAETETADSDEFENDSDASGNGGEDGGDDNQSGGESGGDDSEGDGDGGESDEAGDI